MNDCIPDRKDETLPAIPNRFRGCLMHTQTIVSTNETNDCIKTRAHITIMAMYTRMTKIEEKTHNSWFYDRIDIGQNVKLAMF